MAQDKSVAWGWAGAQYVANNWMKYKLTLEAFNRLWEMQDERCAGCLEPLAHPLRKEQRTGVKPEVDHNHATGVVRGLLCRRCNDFLGKVQDNKEMLLRLEAYLRRNGEPL